MVRVRSGRMSMQLPAPICRTNVRRPIFGIMSRNPLRSTVAGEVSLRFRRLPVCVWRLQKRHSPVAEAAFASSRSDCRRLFFYVPTWCGFGRAGCLCSCPPRSAGRMSAARYSGLWAAIPSGQRLRAKCPRAFGDCPCAHSGRRSGIRRPQKRLPVLIFFTFRLGVGSVGPDVYAAARPDLSDECPPPDIRDYGPQSPPVNGCGRSIPRFRRLPVCVWRPQKRHSPALVFLRSDWVRVRSGRMPMQRPAPICRTNVRRPIFGTMGRNPLWLTVAGVVSPRFRRPPVCA